MVSQGRAASLIQLKKQLRTIDIASIAVCKNKDSSSLLSPHLEDCSILDVFRVAPSRIYIDLLNLSNKLVHCWKSVGRLLGISPNELDIIVLQENLHQSQPYQLIYNWQRREGRGATFGALFKAIHRMYHPDDDQMVLVNDAHHFCVFYIHKYLPIPGSCTVASTPAP